MNKNIVYAFIFAGGVGAGVLGTYSYFKRKFYKDFDEKVQKEAKELADIEIARRCIDKEKETAEKALSLVDNSIYGMPMSMYAPIREDNRDPAEIDEEMHKKLNDILKDYTPDRKEDVQVTRKYTEPDVYIIEPEEFEDNATYDSECLTLYSDGTICDELNEPITDAERLLGKDWRLYLEEAATAYFRNDNIETDFEVARDLRTYLEATGEMVSSDD